MFARCGATVAKSCLYDRKAGLWPYLPEQCGAWIERYAEIGPGSSGCDPRRPLACEGQITPLGTPPKGTQLQCEAALLRLVLTFVDP